MSLARLEKDFQDYVLDEAAGIEAEVVGTSRVPVATRLAIYADAYRARLAEALQTNYSELAKLLGAEHFQALAHLYIECHRPAHFSIRWYGEHLPELLAAESPYRERPLLAELATWEWNMGLAFDAADVPALTKAALERVAPEGWAGLRFKPHPSLRLLALNTNAPVVWKALNRDEEPPADTRDGTAFPNWIVWRRAIDTFFRSLEPAESRALQAAASGESFAGICEAVAEEVGEERAAGAAAQFLALWLQEGLLAA